MKVVRMNLLLVRTDHLKSSLYLKFKLNFNIFLEKKTLPSLSLL